MDSLRRNLYVRHGYGIPKSPLYMDVEKVKQLEKNIEIGKRCREKLEIQGEPEIIPKTGTEDEYILIDAISSIGLAMCLCSQEHLNEKEIDECLNCHPKLYNLPLYMDSCLAICIEAMCSLVKCLGKYKDNVHILHEIFDLVLDEVCKRIYSIDAKNEVADTELKINGDIDTSSLELGLVVKNYKSLCSLIGVMPTTGKSKQLQLNDFKRFFDWEKSGQKFIITDIYDEPIEKQDKRKMGNNSIYVQYIELILLQYLAKQNGQTKTLTKRNWWEFLGMVNEKYNRIPRQELEKVDYTITQFEINHFYQRCNKKLEQILFSALNNLRNRKLIDYELQTVIVDVDNKYTFATDLDKQKILEQERYVLKNIMGYEKIVQVFLKFKQNEYYQAVNERLKELYGWHHYFKQIKLIYVPHDVLDAIPETEVRLQRELLNKKIGENLNAEAEKKFEQEQEKKQMLEYAYGHQSLVSGKNAGIWKIPETYVTAQRILVEELINIGHKKDGFVLPEIDAGFEEMDQIFGSFLC